MEVKLKNWKLVIYSDHEPPHCHLFWDGGVCRINLETWEIMDGQAPDGWKKKLKKWEKKNNIKLLTLAQEKLK